MLLAVPAALWLVALAIPIVGLYILKVRLRRLPVSTNLFWKQIYDEKPPRSIWQQLRHWLSLLAQLLILGLLVFALADPYLSWQALQARRLVIVLDTSASMRAKDVTPSRFEAARSAAHQVLDGLRSRDQVAVVSAGSRPEVVLGMAGHVPTLRRAIDSITLTDAGSSLDAAIELGKQLIGDHPHGQVLVLTDGCGQRPDRTTTLTPQGPQPSTETKPETKPESPDAYDASDAIDVRHQIFATDAANLGITQFQARRSLVDPIGYEVLVEVRNASDQFVSGRLELELDGIPIDVIPVRLKPEETWSRVIEKTSLEGGDLHASLTQVAMGSADEGASGKQQADSGQEAVVNLLPTDDTAWAIVPQRMVQDVLIVSPGNLFLQKVFAANPLVNVTVRNDFPDQWPSDTILVCHRLVPEKLPGGQILIVDPETNCDLWDVREVIENPIVTEQADDSPLMTHIRLDNVLMPEARRLQFKSSIKSLAETVTGDVVYAVVDRAEGACLVLSVNLERSDLAFRTAFPILITNALSWFAGQPGELQPSVAAGQMTSLAATASTVESARATQAMNIARTLISPSQQRSPLPSNQVGPLNEVGIWQVVDGDRVADTQADGEDEHDHEHQSIAVNLASWNESDLRPDAKMTSYSRSSLSGGAWLTRPIWFYLVVVACLLSTLEWFLYQRRFIS